MIYSNEKLKKNFTHFCKKKLARGLVVEVSYFSTSFDRIIWDSNESVMFS